MDKQPPRPEYKSLSDFLDNELLTHEPDPIASKIFADLSHVWSSKNISRNEFLRICKWKSPRPRMHFESNSEEDIKSTIREAIDSDNESDRIKKLTSLSGVSFKMASAILTAINPNAYGMIDFRVWQVLHRLNEVNTKPLGDTLGPRHWVKYLDIIRKHALERSTTPRMVEISLFTYHKRSILDNQKIPLALSSEFIGRLHDCLEEKETLNSAISFALSEYIDRHDNGILAAIFEDRSSIGAKLFSFNQCLNDPFPPIMPQDVDMREINFHDLLGRIHFHIDFLDDVSKVASSSPDTYRSVLIACVQGGTRSPYPFLSNVVDSGIGKVIVSPYLGESYSKHYWKVCARGFQIVIGDRSSNLSDRSIGVFGLINKPSILTVA